MSWIQVLVAGSDAGKRAALVDILAECGLEPMITSNLEETRAILEQKSIHVVFCEDNLPEGGFREVLRMVRTTRPQTQVIVSSMLGDLDEYIEAMNLGAFDFIAPPYSGTDIVSVVDSACQQYRLKRKDETFFYIQSEESEEFPHGGKSVA